MLQTIGVQWWMNWKLLERSIISELWYVSLLSIANGDVLFFQAEDGIRDLVRSRGLGDVYKRQSRTFTAKITKSTKNGQVKGFLCALCVLCGWPSRMLSLIHI